MSFFGFRNLVSRSFDKVVGSARNLKNGFAVAALLAITPALTHASTLIFQAEFDSTLTYVSQGGYAHSSDYSYFDNYIQLVDVFGAGKFTDGMDIGDTRRGQISIYQDPTGGSLGVDCRFAGLAGGNYCLSESWATSTFSNLVTADSIDLSYANYTMPFSVEVNLDTQGGSTLTVIPRYGFIDMIGDISYFAKTDFELRHTFSFSNVTITTPTPVPLPASGLLLSLGLLALARFRNQST